jgi:hypothetical protein
MSDSFNPFDRLYYNMPNMQGMPVQEAPYWILGTKWLEYSCGWTGVWIRREGTNIFDATWFKPGKSDVTAEMTVHLQGSNVTIERRKSNNKVECDLQGVISYDGISVSGTYSCKGATGRWGAIISHQNNPILGTAWAEQESGWRGVWRRRGDSNIFDARWTKPGQSDVTAVMTVHIIGKNVKIQRIHSNGVICTYQGVISENGRTVSGTFRCPRGRTTSWSAEIFH